MIQWLHRYIFRGIGLLFVIGMITALATAIRVHEDQKVHAPRPFTHRLNAAH